VVRIRIHFVPTFDWRLDPDLEPHSECESRSRSRRIQKRINEGGIISVNSINFTISPLKLNVLFVFEQILPGSVSALILKAASLFLSKADPKHWKDYRNIE
jgi:hypothetical protein